MYLHHYLFVTENVTKIDENNLNERRKSSYLPNNFMNFNEFFRKNVAYDNLKSQDKIELYPFSRKYIFGKSMWNFN